MMPSKLLLLAALGSAIAWPVGNLLTRRSRGWLLALLPAGLFVAVLASTPVIAAGGAVAERIPWVPSLDVALAFRLDGFSFLFALLITGIGALVVVYADAYLSEHPPRARARFHTLILCFMTAMLGAVLADDLVVLFLFWEATSFLSFLLIGFDVDSPSARRSALMSLRVTAGGGLALLVAVLLIGMVLGSYSLSGAVSRAGELAASPWSGAILAGVFIGAFTKSAQFPFHFWLPNAMQAPTPASAYLHSATMVKLGIYLLARFEPVIGAISGGRELLMVVALATMLAGAYQALRAENFKAVLAYSTVASLGILCMLIALDGPMASVATVGFILAHALYKATLFFCAGTVLHATGLSRLRQLGGLGRFLPVTATAAALASLSMAGLPPFLGFITKEFLFEAQLRSSWDIVPMAIAVLVNAVIVGVAGIVTLRPFFLNAGRVRSVRHREVTGLLVGPMTLALLGLVISLDSEWSQRSVLQPAAVAIYGAPVDVSVRLWHGVTPMLALSFIVVGIGILIFAYWGPIHRRLRRQSFLDRYETEHVYDALLRRVQRAAGLAAGMAQHGDLRRYMGIVLAGVLVIVAWGLVAAGVPMRAFTIDAIRPGSALIALVGLAGGVAATRAATLPAAMIGTGLAGLVTALLFMMYGAPDLALTQFAVESLVVVLLTAALLTLPLRSPRTRTGTERTRDLLIAGGFSVLIFVALLDVGMASNPGTITKYFADHSLAEAFGRNVVNVILVDFRGFDTLGETTVIALSTIIAFSLLGPHVARRAAAAPPAQPVRSFMLQVTSPLFFWLLLGLSVVELLRGHNEIGGGFVGGLTAALAFAVVLLAHGSAQARRMLRVRPLALAGSGLLLAAVSGLPGLVVHGDFLRHLWFHFEPFGWELHVGTTLLFDLGVYLAVMGAVLASLFGFAREAAS